MNYRIENTGDKSSTVAWHFLDKPWAVIADRKWNPIVGRYTTKAGAQRKIRDLQRSK